MVEIDGVSVDNATLLLSAFVKLRLRFYCDLQPLPDFPGGLGCVLQLIQIPGLDPQIQVLQLAAHIRQLTFQRVDGSGQARGPVIRGDQNHACSCLMRCLFFQGTLRRDDMKKRPPGRLPGPRTHLVQHVASDTPDRTPSQIAAHAKRLVWLHFLNL